MITAAEQDPNITPTAVRVKEPFRVVHKGNAHTAGDEITVPQHLAEQWLTAGWVKPATTKEKS